MFIIILAKLTPIVMLSWRYYVYVDARTDQISVSIYVLGAGRCTLKCGFLPLAYDYPTHSGQDLPFRVLLFTVQA